MMWAYSVRWVSKPVVMVGCLSRRLEKSYRLRYPDAEPRRKNSRIKTYEVCAQRKPAPRPRNDGEWIARAAARRASGPLPQEPLRIALESPTCWRSCRILRRAGLVIVWVIPVADPLPDIPDAPVRRGGLGRGVQESCIVLHRHLVRIHAYRRMEMDRSPFFQTVVLFPTAWT